MAHKLGFLMFAGLGLVNAGLLSVNNCADRNAFGCDQPIVSLEAKSAHHQDDDWDHVHVLGEKKIELGWNAPHTHTEKTLHENEWKADKDHIDVKSKWHHDDDHHSWKSQHDDSDDSDSDSNDDHDHKEWHHWRDWHDDDDHHHQHDEHVHVNVVKQAVPVVSTIPAVVVAPRPVVTVQPVGWVGQPVIVHVVHKYPIPDFEPLSQKPVVLTQNDVKSPISIVSIPNVHNVPFESHRVAVNERLGKSNCPECETEKEAAHLRNYANKELFDYDDKLTTDIKGPIEDVDAYASNHEHFYLYTHDFDDCHETHEHIHVIGTHRYLHANGKIFFQDVTRHDHHHTNHDDLHHTAQHDDEVGHQHLNTHHYQPQKDEHDWAHAKKEAKEERAWQRQAKEVKKDIIKGEIRENAPFVVGQPLIYDSQAEAKQIIYHHH